jgi:hypothetical protein
MYITILKFSQFPDNIKASILEKRPDLTSHLNAYEEDFHILENGHVFYNRDLIYNKNKKNKAIPCYAYPKNSFDFSQFFSLEMANVLEYSDLISDFVVDPDHISFQEFLNKFNDIYSNFGSEVCHWLLLYRYLKPFALQNKYQVSKNVAKRILDCFTELGFIKKNRDGWNVTTETEFTIRKKIEEFINAKENMWVTEENQEPKENEKEMTDSLEEELLPEEMVVTPVIKSKSKKSRG